MYKNFLIIASKRDKAGINITTALSQYGKFNFHLIEEDILHEENFIPEKINQSDFIIFASKHKSEKKDRTISLHAPGNWADALYGGKPSKVSRTSAQFLKQCFAKLKSNVEEYKLDYKVTMEVTHHGPLMNKPCMFIEIGSTDMEWNDRRAAFAVARTIKEMIEEYKENKYNENVIAIGGPHYCQSFNKIQLESNVAISHIIPNYVLPLTEGMVRQAINNTDEEVDFALLDWKGIKSAKERQNVLDILNKLYIQHKRTSQVNKEYNSKD